MFYADNIKIENYTCQTNGSVSDSITQNWTLSALECYKLNSDCTQCSIAHANYSFKCQMKRIVDVLLRTKGLPNEKAIINSSSEEKNIVA